MRRSARLPRDWKAVRRRVLVRDGFACQWAENGLKCGAYASHVDHIEYGTSGPVPDDRLQSLCEPHHNTKTASEGGRATAARYRKRNRNRREHPGLIDGSSVP